MPAKKTTRKPTEPAAPKKAAPARKAAKKAVKKTAAKAAKAVSASPPPKVTPDMIARAAYLNYRRRIEQGLPGDRESDWLEAERQFAK